jgi:hypothetical protein
LLCFASRHFIYAPRSSIQSIYRTRLRPVGPDLRKLEEEKSSSATGNPFGDSDIPDHHASHRLEDGNYSDCDNESDEEDDSDHETDSPKSTEKKNILNSKLQLAAAVDTEKLKDASSISNTKKKIIGTFLG